jgi:hypothetical protein
MAKIRFNRCRNCESKYHGVEKNKEGKVLRIFDCKSNCLALSGVNL